MLGPVYWMHFAYTNALIGVGTVILVSRLLRVSAFYRRQSISLLAAVLVPLLGNLASSLELPLARDYDPTPVAVTIGALVLVWGVFRYRLLDLVPVARSLMFDRLGDPVLVLDAYGRVVDGNPAALALQDGEVIGRAGRRAAAGAGRRAARRDPVRRRDPPRRAPARPREFEVISSTLHDDRGRDVGRLMHLRDISARKHAERRLRWLADYDQLTNLPNRRLLTDRLEQAISRARRSARPLRAAARGPRPVQAHQRQPRPPGGRRRCSPRVGQRLRAGRRTDDVAARLGGDEFAVLLPDIASAADADPGREPRARPAHRADAPRLAGAGRDGERRRRRVAGRRHRRAVAVQPGGRRDVPGEGRTAATAPSAPRPSRARRRRTGCSSASTCGTRCAGDELRVLFQPMVDLHDHAVTGMEALLRWQHPRLGLLPPAAFLHVAEEAGLSAAIDRWVLGQACRHGSRWAAAGHDVAVAVNVSPARFSDAPLTLTDGRRPGPAGRRCCRRRCSMLEINERTIIDDPEPVARELSDLRDLGVGVALDDFGAGHTSLTHLRQLPIDMLKIDHGLVRGITSEDSDDGRILSAVTTLAHILGMTVTAEGVERPDQVAVLQRTGCNAAQGFLFAPPMDPSAAGHPAGQGPEHARLTAPGTMPGC